VSAAIGGGPAGSAAVRRHNLGLVLETLRVGPLSRAELAARTGLTRATVASLVEPLLGSVLAEETAAPRGVGRPARPVRFHPRGPVALGIAVDVDSLTVALLDLGGEVVAQRTERGDNRAHSPDALSARAASLARGARDEAGRVVLGAGLALPAVVDGADGSDGSVSARAGAGRAGMSRVDAGAGSVGDGASAVVLRAPNLPRWAGARPGPPLEAALGVPVVVENEATAGAVAHLGVAPDFVYVSAGIGIGGGIVLGGRIFRGVRGLAGELGHVVVERDGPRCGCGGRGCVEQYAGRAALLQDAGAPDVAALATALARGDGRAAAATRRAGAALGVALASVLNVLDVPTVVLGGDYAPLAGALAPAVATELRTRALHPDPPAILPSDLDGSAAVRGAAHLVLEQVFRRPTLLSA
jgi:predicted NBD/HSP70 family sugar kinase